MTALRNAAPPAGNRGQEAANNRTEQPQDTTTAILRGLACANSSCLCHQAELRGKGNTHCPAHDDSAASLTVTPPDRTTWPLLNCKAGCSFDGVLAALRERGLVPRKVIFTVSGQRHYRTDYPDGSKLMDWDRGAKTKLAFYRGECLATLTAGATVIVTEGEKATEAAVSLGYAAVATVCGAGSIPVGAALETLRGFDAVLAPDNDKPGHEHMAKMAAALNAMGIPARWLEVPGLPAKGDLADYTGSSEELARLVASAPKWEPEQSSQDADNSPAAPWEAARIDWATFWDVDRLSEDWLVEPLIPRGRRVTTYAAAKEGKSLLALDVAARLATGRRCFDRPAGNPVDVLYIDLEMTENDLYERLQDMGYGAGDDLSHLHYYLLPSLPPLNTPEGGLALQALADQHRPDLTVIDTTSAALEGPENDADSMRDFGRFTATPLKARGIAVWRLDHAGKDVTRGQRGTSAKNDGEDLVWLLTGSEDGVTLKATHRRQGWIPSVVDLVRLEDPLRHERGERGYLPGTPELAARLEELGVPVYSSSRAVQAALKEAGTPRRREAIVAAQHYRRESGTTPGTTSESESGTTPGTPPQNRFGNHPRNHPEPPDADTGNHRFPLEGNRGTSPQAQRVICPAPGCLFSVMHGHPCPDHEVTLAEALEVIAMRCGDLCTGAPDCAGCRAGRAVAARKVAAR